MVAVQVVGMRDNGLGYNLLGREGRSATRCDLVAK